MAAYRFPLAPNARNLEPSQVNGTPEAMAIRKNPKIAVWVVAFRGASRTFATVRACQS